MLHLIDHEPLEVVRSPEHVAWNFLVIADDPGQDETIAFLRLTTAQAERLRDELARLLDEDQTE